MNPLNLTVLRSYGLTVLRSYNLTILRSYVLTLLRSYNLTILRSYNLTVLRSYGLTLLRSYVLTVLRSYGLTILRSHGLTILRSYGLTVLRSCILLLFYVFLSSQTAEAQKYAVHFKDKNGTPYSLEHPEAFLSKKALDRREKFSIPLSESDLPVNPDYIEQVKSENATYLLSSKWINCILISCSNSDELERIKNLPFVDSIVYVYPYEKNLSPKKEKKTKPAQQIPLKKDNSIYGNAYNQIQQLNGIAVHEKGYTGNGILIAVLDAGFSNVNTISSFEHLFESGRIVMAKDFVEEGGDIYRSNISGHGTSVLSCMAAYWPNVMVGTAPQAAYCLFRTENNNSEFLIEEYTWVIGAETADSIGADLINSSLVYTTYDDPSMGHSFSDMDGKSTIAAIGANKAVECGIFVCVAAGNDGNSTSWPWIGTPSDATNALTVGAVNSNGAYASFSSIGPNAAGEQKPNTMAQGADATIINNDGTARLGSGTSYATPITCGMVACLLQASSTTPPHKLKEIIEKSSTLYETPSPQMGYGIPDFYAALSELPISEKTKCNNIFIYPNPGTNILSIKSEYNLKKVFFYDIAGRLVAEYSIHYPDYKINIETLSAGMYIVRMQDDQGFVGCAKFIKE